MNSPETHLAVAEAAQQTCEQCDGLFTPTRGWARFCKNKCRNDFHGRAARVEAIKEKALAMYEALRTVREVIRGKDVEHVWLNAPTEPAETPGTLIDRALGDLKAP